MGRRLTRLLFQMLTVFTLPPIFNEPNMLMHRCSRKHHFKWAFAVSTVSVCLCFASLICQAASPADFEAPWWSLQPLIKPRVPSAADGEFKTWPRTPIDHFILAKLGEKQLHPAPPADKRTLLRRVYFDLI